jgi:hypothetical protein
VLSNLPANRSERVAFDFHRLSASFNKVEMHPLTHSYRLCASMLRGDMGNSIYSQHPSKGSSSAEDLGSSTVGDGGEGAITPERRFRSAAGGNRVQSIRSVCLSGSTHCNLVSE